MCSPIPILKQKDVEYAAYRKKSILHNRETSIYLSLAILVLFIIINAIWYFLDLSRDFPQEVYFSRNLRILAIVGLLNLSYIYLSTHLKLLRKNYISQIIIICISISILFLSCINSYVISMNPKNNLTPILIGAITVSALFRFSIRESIFVFICGLFFFSSLFIFWQSNSTIFALNLAAIFNIYALAFIINRTIFNNAFRFFKQIHLTESINLTLKNAILQKDEVLEIVAHDLRGPIDNVKYISELLKSTETPEEEKDQLIELINTSCGDAELIINDIIAIAKLKHTPNPIEIVCLNDILQKIAKDFIGSSTHKNIRYHVPEKQLYSRVYVEKLKRVIDNLLNNAIKFTPSNKKIELILSSENSYNFIEIKDEGIGIELGKRNKLFQKYSEASREGINGEKSVGLGLFIVKELVQMMNGDVHYEANEIGGSRFIIRLPNS